MIVRLQIANSARTAEQIFVRRLTTRAQFTPVFSCAALCENAQTRTRKKLFSPTSFFLDAMITSR
jgi:hypothetical protein